MKLENLGTTENRDYREDRIGVEQSINTPQLSEASVAECEHFNRAN